VCLFHPSHYPSLNLPEQHYLLHTCITTHHSGPVLHSHYQLLVHHISCDLVLSFTHLNLTAVCFVLEKKVYKLWKYTKSDLIKLRRENIDMVYNASIFQCLIFTTGGQVMTMKVIANAKSTSSTLEL